MALSRKTKVTPVWRVLFFNGRVPCSVTLLSAKEARNFKRGLMSDPATACVSIEPGTQEIPAGSYAIKCSKEYRRWLASPDRLKRIVLGAAQVAEGLA